MSKERNRIESMEYFEYNEYFKDKIKTIGQKLNDGSTTDLNEIAQSLFEIVKETLKTIAANSVEKKYILEGFVETIIFGAGKQELQENNETIEAKSIVFDKFAEKLQEFIQDGTASKIFQKYEEQLQEIVAASKPQELSQDIIFLSEEEKPPLELGESLLDVDIPAFSAANRAIDPITQAIRDQILTKQRELIVTALVKNNTVKQEELDDLNKFRAYFENEQNKETISELLKVDKNLKQDLEQVEIIGYKNVHTQFADRFSTMEWKDGAVENANGITTKKQIVRDADGQEIATLSEATHKINPPHTVQKSDGTKVTINNYRTIDFPITLDNKGPMHLSLAVKDQHGRNIAASKAVYFTAHYDDNGKLVEVSSPHPVKFSGNSPDAVGYIEHGGQIYTLPVTQEKYKEMMQEVAKNLGQGVDISPSIETPDLIITSRQKIEEPHPHRVQENMMPIDVVKNEEVVLSVDNSTYYKPEQVAREEKIEPVAKSQTMSRNSEFSPVVVDQVENIIANLSKSRQPSFPTKKTNEEIITLVESLSKNLVGKDFEEQKKHIDKELKNLSTPQEQIKLLQGLAEDTAEKRGKALEQINLGNQSATADPIRLITETKKAVKDDEIVKPKRKAEHANIKYNVKLQAFIQNKINEVSKKPTIIPKIRTGKFQGIL